LEPFGEVEEDYPDEGVKKGKYYLFKHHEDCRLYRYDKETD